MAYNVFALGEQGEENTNVEQGWNKEGKNSENTFSRNHSEPYNW